MHGNIEAMYTEEREREKDLSRRLRPVLPANIIISLRGKTFGDDPLTRVTLLNVPVPK